MSKSFLFCRIIEVGRGVGPSREAGKITGFYTYKRLNSVCSSSLPEGRLEPPFSDGFSGVGRGIPLQKSRLAQGSPAGGTRPGARQNSSISVIRTIAASAARRMGSG